MMIGKCCVEFGIYYVVSFVFLFFRVVVNNGLSFYLTDLVRARGLSLQSFIIQITRSEKEWCLYLWVGTPFSANNNVNCGRQFSDCDL